MLPFWARDTIIAIEPGWVDDRGTQTPDYDNPESTTAISGCSVQPGNSPEVLGDRQSVTVRWTLYAPAAAINAYSAVVWQGVRYAVDGEPLVWTWPDGSQHLVAALVDWKG